MNKEASLLNEAEEAFAREIYRDRAALNREAQEVLASGTRRIVIRLSGSEIALAKRQADARGLKYQTYIRMLLHEALVAHTV